MTIKTSFETLLKIIDFIIKYNYNSYSDTFEIISSSRELLCSSFLGFGKVPRKRFKSDMSKKDKSYFIIIIMLFLEIFILLLLNIFWNNKTIFELG